MAAAAGAAAAAGKIAGQESAGILKEIVHALERDVLTFRWERPVDSQGNPRTDRKLVLSGVELHVTTGLVLGVAGLGLAWEIGNWFAQSLSKNPGSVQTIVDILANPAGVDLALVGGIMSLLPKPPTGSSQKVTVPATFGAALNGMLRDLTVAGPGVLSQQARNLAGLLTLPKSS